MNLRRATEWLREAGSLPLLLLALLLVAGGLSAQDRSPANDSSAGDRVAVPISEADPAPSYAPPDPPADSPSDSPSDDSPSEAPSESPGAPPDTPSETLERYAVPEAPAEPRYAVPGVPSGPHRRPPSDDGSGGSEIPDPPVEMDNEVPAVDEEARWDSPSCSGSWWSPFSSRCWGRPGFTGRPGPSGGRGEMGALDLDVKPGRTQVYLDGHYVGVVDRYDGWPSYLVLERGTYDLVFYLDGYRTLSRRVTIQPRAVIGLHDRLKPGPSVRPEDLPTRTAP